MILFTILLIMIILLIAFIVLAFSIGGTAFVILFGDVIVCIVFIVLLIKRIFFKK